MGFSTSRSDATVLVQVGNPEALGFFDFCEQHAGVALELPKSLFVANYAVFKNVIPEIHHKIIIKELFGHQYGMRKPFGTP